MVKAIEVDPHSGILRLYRDLIALRKRHPSLNNCRKDLTEIRFDEQAKFLVMKRSDPDGESSLLVLNFSAEFHSIPVGVRCARVESSFVDSSGRVQRHSEACRRNPGSLFN